MPIVQSFGAVQAMTNRQAALWTGSGSGGSVTLYGRAHTYAMIYATQPNVRTCVDFLARNIAQLGLHAYRRVSDTDRVRVADHEMIGWLMRPNPSTRAYRLKESLIGDLGIYFNAYWLKVRYTDVDGRRRIGLVRIPPDQIRVAGGLLKTHFVWTVDGRERPFPLSEIVHFDGYNPLNGLMGLSPLETLRRILAEEAAAGDHRESYWRNAGRMEGIIEQTAEAPNWTGPQQDQFREKWQEFSAGGAKVGMTAVLPKGMTLKPWSFNARDSEYTAARKLTREECAAAYHIPLPMVGILEHATFSNIKEQHKHLYQDCLGPWLEMLSSEMEGQLLPECEDQRDIYLEFNIAEKLKGSFEEQASGLQVLVGRPIMTANEGRARLNLPAMTDDPSADRLAEQQGGPAAPGAPFVTRGGSAPRPEPDDDEDEDVDARFARHATTAATVAVALDAASRRQQAHLAKVVLAERPGAFDADRWNAELAADLTPMIGATEAQRVAATHNEATLSRLRHEATP